MKKILEFAKKISPKLSVTDFGKLDSKEGIKEVINGFGYMPKNDIESIDDENWLEVQNILISNSI